MARYSRDEARAMEGLDTENQGRAFQSRLEEVLEDYEAFASRHLPSEPLPERLLEKLRSEGIVAAPTGKKVPVEIDYADLRWQKTLPPNFRILRADELVPNASDAGVTIKDILDALKAKGLRLATAEEIQLFLRRMTSDRGDAPEEE